MLDKLLLVLSLIRHVVYSDCTILTGSPDFTMTANVVFNITDPLTNKFEIMGPAINEVRYGISSSYEDVKGVVVLAAREEGNHFGCMGSPYRDVNLELAWIALVERGKCSFYEKIKKAALGNASAVIVFNNEYTEEIITMKHPGENNIVAVSIPRNYGLPVQYKILNGSSVSVTITKGFQVVSRNHKQSNISIIFVSLSFLILLIISMTWLVVYYVHRFRILHSPDLLKRRKKVQKVVSSLPKRNLQDGDKEILCEEICPICIEVYKAEDTLRILPCQHFFHRKCVDFWLVSRETCPLCKYDIMKPASVMSSSSAVVVSLEAPSDEIWEENNNEPNMSVLLEPSQFEGQHSSSVAAIESSENLPDVHSRPYTPYPSQNV